MRPFPILVAVIAICAAIGVISWVSQSGSPGSAVIEEEKASATNPLTVATSGPHPTAVLEEEKFDFGSMILGDTDNHAFVIRNEGDAPLTLEKGKIACKCTVPTIPAESIPPGGSAEVVMEWKPLGPSPEFDKWAEIWTNDPEHEKVTLRITGIVRELVSVVPASPWAVSGIGEDEPGTFEGVIAAGEDSFEIVNIEPSSDGISVETRPMSASELMRIEGNPGSGYVLTGTVQPTMPVGRFEERIVVTTDLENDYVATISVVGTRPGPFSILGQAWYGNEMTVRMGTVKSSEGKTLTLSMFVPKEDEPIVLTSMEATPDVAQVTLTRDDSFPAKVKDKYDLTFTIPPGAAGGQYTNQNRVRLRLTTNRESIPEIDFYMDALIE